MEGETHGKYYKNWCLTDDGIKYGFKLIPFSEIRGFERSGADYALMQCFSGKRYFLYYELTDKTATYDIKLAENKAKEYHENNPEKEIEFDKNSSKLIHQEQDKESRKGTFLIIAFFAMILLIIAMSIIPVLFSSGSSSGSSEFECGVCHRDFDGNPENMRSISNTNMCVQCYKNYEWANSYISYYGAG